MKKSKTTPAPASEAKVFEVDDEVMHVGLGRYGRVIETCHITHRCRVMWENSGAPSNWLHCQNLEPFLESLPPPIAPAPTSLPFSTSKMTYKRREYYIHGNPSAARYWYVIDGVHSAQAYDRVVAANIAARKAIDRLTGSASKRRC